MIPLSVPSIRGNEWLYIKECLDTEWVSSAGKYVNKFEEDMGRFAGAKHAIACVNGTAALQVALRLVGVQQGDEVIVPTVTFVAPVNAVRYLNADPIFMDCDDYYNISTQKTVEFIRNETAIRNNCTYSKASGKKISAIIPVHVFGNAVELDTLVDVCRERNIKVVEDASESVGTFYSVGQFKGKHTGTIGDIGCFSFNGNKIITTGGGGMIVTGDDGYAERARYLTTQAKDDEVRYVHNDVGYNYRLTNIQAALGVAQLEQLTGYLGLKKKNYLEYKKEIDQIRGLHVAEPPPYAENNFWMYALQIEKAVYGRSREEVASRFNQAKIQTRPIWFLNHLQKPYVNCRSYRIEKAPEMLEKTLNIPCSVNLKNDDIRTIVNVLKHG
jgi:perosamine synthetase